ncbi:DEAD/DEAH box helicase [Corynebacterium doosanense]|uniref:DEAD/DEAH box helicase n=1 Tax=Corynebacterium doosanense TaxID=1121358 RepID=UPI00037DEA09|nr:SNF2-related protein [Corynebacterium doosanense]
MAAPEITSTQLSELLGRASSLRDLSARGSAAAAALTDGTHGGAAHPTYLHEEEDWVFFIPPWDVTWPAGMYARAEAARIPDLASLIGRVAEASARVDALVPQARHAAPGVLTRLFAGARTERARQAAQQVDAELRAVTPAAARLFDQLAVLSVAEERQRQGVSLIDGPAHLTAAAREALATALCSHIGQPRELTIEPFDPTPHVGVLERARLLAEAPGGEPVLRARAEKLLDQLVSQRVDALLEQLPVSALRQATADRLRIEGLEPAGLTSVAWVAEAPRGRLTQLPGIGERTAERLHAAAETLRREAAAAEPRAIGTEPTAAARELLRVVAQFAGADTLEPEERARRRRLVDYVQLIPDPARTSEWIVARTGDTLFTRLTEDLAWGAAHTALLDPPAPVSTHEATWDDYLARPAYYQGLLATLLADGDGEDGHDLDARTLEAIRELRLDRSLLNDDVHLRGYQSFGARFAVVRSKIILGDEMGLGKTVQALAAAAHIAAVDGVERTRILVLCPASVVVNWRREASKFTRLPVYVAHGTTKHDAVDAWQGTGGICILTFDGARTMDIAAPEVVIVDEAHMIKNPQARRSKAARTLIDAAPHALLMTGTPLENRVEEFATLVSYVDPELLADGEWTSVEFRRQIAPVYLRRNQSDVLDELPGVTETTDWIDLTEADAAHYRDAVASGNWMAIRRAPMTTPSAMPAKLERILEIVDEAAEAGRTVVIFTYFLPVIERLEQELGERVLGTITGALAPEARQAAVDKLSGAAPGSVLLSQISAGGTGLNMQAASVVIIVEPQVKPSIEAQALARVNRMGQTRSVLAHRLIADDTADERMLEMLGRKERIFDAFARESEAAAVADARDVSEGRLAEEIIAAERARLGLDQASR